MGENGSMDINKSVNMLMRCKNTIYKVHLQLNAVSATANVQRMNKVMKIY